MDYDAGGPQSHSEYARIKAQAGKPDVPGGMPWKQATPFDSERSQLHIRGSVMPAGVHLRIHFVCLQCGVAFQARACLVRTGKARVCSRSCAAKSGIASGRSGLVVGAVGVANPHWKGGVSKINTRYTKRYQEKHPEAAAAHRLVSQAKRRKTNRLIPKPCEGCGAAKGVHAHHDDYSKPLEVKWLCGSCHRKHHGMSC